MNVVQPKGDEGRPSSAAVGANRGWQRFATERVQA